MKRAFDGILLKIGRAEKHLRELNAEVDAFVARKLYDLEIIEPERNRAELRGLVREEPPAASWSPIIGA